MTGTELLIEILERFGESEPTSVLVVWGNENDDICMKSNCLSTATIGLAEYAKHNALEGIFKP